jgi:hypothetical protein
MKGNFVTPCLRGETSGFLQKVILRSGNSQRVAQLPSTLFTGHGSITPLAGQGIWLPQAMKNPLFPAIASAAHVPPATGGAWWNEAWGKQSPPLCGDCFVATLLAMTCMVSLRAESMSRPWCHCERSACPERSVGKAISWPIWGLLSLRVRFAVVAKNAPRKDMHNGFDAGLSSYHSFLIR